MRFLYLRSYREPYGELNKNKIDITLERGNDKTRLRFDGHGGFGHR